MYLPHDIYIWQQIIWFTLYNWVFPYSQEIMQVLLRPSCLHIPSHAAHADEQESK